MSPRQSSSAIDLLSMAEKQGETFATVREIKHAVNNMSQKVDAMAFVVEQVKQLSLDRDDHEKRLTVLEADKHRREGAVGLVEWVSRHWPFTILIGIATVVWGMISGKVP